MCSASNKSNLLSHDDVTKWKHFPHYWPFLWGIHRSPANSPHKGQWRGALMFSLICAWVNGWVNHRQACDLRRIRASLWRHCNDKFLVNQDGFQSGYLIYFIFLFQIYILQGTPFSYTVLPWCPVYKIKYIDMKNTYIHIHKYKSYIIVTISW